MGGLGENYPGLENATPSVRVHARARMCVYHTPLFPVQNSRAMFVHEEQMEMDGQPYRSEDQLPTSG